MAFFVTFLWSLAFNVLAQLLAPQKGPKNAKPSGLSEFQIPTAQEGRAVPVVFGTCHVTGPNVTWYGNLKTVAIKKKQKTGLFSSKKVTIGFKYFLSMEIMIAHGPVDAIEEIRFGDQTAAFTTFSYVDGWGYNYNDENLFGGKEKGGGVSGVIRVRQGTTTQLSDSHVSAIVGSPVPAFRRICTAVLQEFYLGTSAYIKPLSFVVRRIPNSLGLPSGQHNINNDANPAAVIYEALVNDLWGAGIPESLINSSSFLAAGAVLKAENLGISMLLEGQPTVEEFITEVLKHVDGGLYSDPATGLVTMKLARDDYDVGDLMVLDESNVESVDFQRPALSELKNVVRVKYFDREANFAERVVQAQDTANIAARDGLISVEDVELQGITNATTATFAASRAIKTFAYPLAKIRLVGNRELGSLRIASVFKLVWPRDGLDAVYRVTSMSFGTITSPAITVDAVEDVFSVATNAYTPPENSTWIPPSVVPVDLAVVVVQELPRYELQLLMEPNEFTALSTSQSYNQTLAAQPSSFVALDYYMHTRLSGGTYVQEDDGQPFTASAALNGGLTQISTSMVVRDVQALDYTPTHALLSGKEYVAITAISGSSYTIRRGALDTVAQIHVSGGSVFFFSADPSYGVDPNVRNTGAVAQYKLVANTPADSISVSSATERSVTVGVRHHKPYPPGALKLNGAAYAAAIVADSVTMTWVQRNRLTSGLNGDNAATTTPETNTTYNVILRKKSNNAVIKNVTGIIGTSWYGGTPADDVYLFELQAVRDGILSFQKHVHEFSFTGPADPAWNLNWGIQWGKAAGRAQISTVTLGGVFDEGITYYVVLGGTPFTYTALIGDVDLDGVAVQLSALIDAHADYVSTSVGPVIEITGPYRTPYSVATGIDQQDDNTIVFSVFQAASAVITGNRMAVFFRWDGTLGPSSWDTDAGTELRLEVQDHALARTATGYKTEMLSLNSRPDPVDQVFQINNATLLNIQQAVDSWNAGLSANNKFEFYQRPAAGYPNGPWPANWSSSFTTSAFDDYDYLAIFPIGKAVHVDQSGVGTGYASQPYSFRMVVVSPGPDSQGYFVGSSTFIPAVTSALPQISDATISGTVDTGYVYTITLAGVTVFTYTALPGDDLVDVATDLTAQIDAHASYSATFSGTGPVVIRITGASQITYATAGVVDVTDATIAHAITQTSI